MADADCIMAIDPAARGCGIAHGAPGTTPQLRTVNFARDDTDTGPIIFRRALEFFNDEFVKPGRPRVLAIEAPLPKFNPMILFGLYAVITATALHWHVRLLPVSVQSWRKHFLGSAKLDKEHAKAAAVRVCKQLKWDAPDHNAAEAAGIWDWACGRERVASIHAGPLFRGAAP
jgi:hypothetical protein